MAMYSKEKSRNTFFLGPHNSKQGSLIVENYHDWDAAIFKNIV